MSIHALASTTLQSRLEFLVHIKIHDLLIKSLISFEFWKRCFALPPSFSSEVLKKKSQKLINGFNVLKKHATHQQTHFSHLGIIKLFINIFFHKQLRWDFPYTLLLRISLSLSFSISHSLSACLSVSLSPFLTLTPHPLSLSTSLPPLLVILTHLLNKGTQINCFLQLLWEGLIEKLLFIFHEVKMVLQRGCWEKTGDFFEDTGSMNLLKTVIVPIRTVPMLDIDWCEE